jgi:MFS family permease
MATVTFVSAITSLFYARLRARMGVGAVYSMLFFVQGVGFMGLSQAHTYAQFSFSLVAVGIGVGLVIVNTNSWLLEWAHEHERLKATGWLTSAIFLGQFISPILLHFPVKTWGIPGAFMLVSGVLFGVSLWVFLRINRRINL